MAAILSPVSALDYASVFIKGQPIETLQERVLDDASKHLWMAAPWRWTIGTVGAITLVDAQMDYTLTAPTDMLYPIYAYSADGATTPQYYDIEPTLPISNTQKGIATRMAYVGSNTWRFYPIPQVTTPSKTVIIMYKKVAPTITVQNSYTAGTLVMDDEWFWVYQEAVLWKAFTYADDTRAGSAQMTSDGKWQYTGKRGEFEAAVQYMREREKLPIFGYQTSPDPKVGTK